MIAAAPKRQETANFDRMRADAESFALQPPAARFKLFKQPEKSRDSRIFLSAKCLPPGDRCRPHRSESGPDHHEQACWWWEDEGC